MLLYKVLELLNVSGMLGVKVMLAEDIIREHPSSPQTSIPSRKYSRDRVSKYDFSSIFPLGVADRGIFSIAPDKFREYKSV